MEEADAKVLEEAEAILASCDELKVRASLELEEARSFLKDCREDPTGRGEELLRVRARLSELIEKIAGEFELTRSWTDEDIALWARTTEAAILKELKRQNTELDVFYRYIPRGPRTSWAKVIEQRKEKAAKG